MKLNKLVFFKILANFRASTEKRIIFIFILIILITHSVFSLFHFHECDSSDVYKYLTDYSIIGRSHWIGHIWKTGFIFTPIRYLFALLLEIIPFDYIKSLFFLPLKMTYPPLLGFIYGLYLPERFGDFYEYGSFINISFFILVILLFYNSLKFLGISKYISFICSFGLLSIYSVNSTHIIWEVRFGLYTVLYYLFLQQYFLIVRPQIWVLFVFSYKLSLFNTFYCSQYIFLFKKNFQNQINF